jgi:uncharacterized protein (DUF1800 family)
MAIGPDFKSGLVALNRFGYGARGGRSDDLASAAADPRSFIKAELARPNAAILQSTGLQPAKENLKKLFAFRAEVQRVRRAPEGQKEPDNSFIQATYRAESLARFQRQFSADPGFVERLVAFWSNHFCVSISKDQIQRVTAGAFEREAIRPHVLGRFADMLRAVEQHPTMLHYLDNQLSFGPASTAGRNRKVGLNENLAREILELHTLGVDGGYTQADVTSLARIITGWTFVGPQGAQGEPGTFLFFANAHEPGAHDLLGKTYAPEGVRQGEQALEDIACHPSTAKFIATKFARHFVADDPPPALVARLAEVFRKTDGDLKALAIALVDDDEAWSAPLTKMRSPQEFLMAATRLVGRLPENPAPLNGALQQLGHMVWQPPGPNGYTDRADAWASPEGMKLRLDLAVQVARRIANPPDPNDLLDLALGPAASPETRDAVRRAESKQQALALLFMSPEFQRR